MRHALLFASALTVLVTGCAAGTAPAASTERELTAADSRVPVQVTVGQVFVVRLPSNASTGYSWAWDQAAAAGVIVQDGEPAMAGVNPDPQTVGSGGTQTWRFRAAAAGQGELRLDYRRPWETGAAPAQTVRWQIQVR
ncbi:protease inhibitor I42 family protein [Lysobacter cavernae]|uniref:Protease inhibitor I42 family protein n=1 Tax=Lysobacter cavernae TaxID=1685901 RepID=A0ABV7RQT2_9GAMM